MRRPPHLTYARDDAVPAGVLVLGGLQHVAVMLGVGIAMPLLVLDRSGFDAGRMRETLSLALVALAVGTLLQVRAGRRLGCAHLVPATFTAAYLGPCISAMAEGGPSLVMGMLLFAGVFQALTAVALDRLRPYLPPEIGGLAVLMIGFTLAMLGVRLIMLPPDGGLPPGVTENPRWLGAVTLVTIIGLSVWATGGLRTYATLIGIAVASVLSVMSGVIAPEALFFALIDGGIKIPVPSLPSPSFSWNLVPDFAVGALICSLRAIGDIVTAQRVEDADWIRPDLSNVRRGMLADGVGTTIGGLLGSPIGLNTFSSGIGLAAAAGVTARRIGWAIAAWLILIALLPGAAAMFMALPKPILGGVLLVSSSQIVFNALLILTSRLLDARRIQLLGLPLLVGLAYEIMPHAFAVLPGWLQVLMHSGLMISVFGALLLNLVFRIGVGRSASTTMRTEALNGAALSDWVMLQGSAWGARRDVMDRVAHALTEIAEARDELMTLGGDVRVDLSFNEYRLKLCVEYDGEPIDLSETAPLEPSDLDKSDLDSVRARMRAGLIRGLANRVTVHPGSAGRQQLQLRFEH